VTASAELLARLQAALGPQYRLERELGYGGMGVVFLARDTTLDRPVAVKVVHPELAVHSSITQRFLAEARMIARLRHPSILAVHSAGEATGLFYYVMDYVPGESLRQRLQREGRLPAGDVVRIVADLADALHAAGQAGLVHRDVKPENILLDEATGRAMLADFGIARALADADGTRTAQGVAVGTPTYMSPEQAAGDAVDARSDLYSLGVVAYEMLAGRPPFRASNAAAVASMHLAEQPAPVESLRSESPAPLALAIGQALRKDPAERWQTGADFRAAVLGERVQVPVAAPARRRRRLLLAGGVLAAALPLAVLTLRPAGPPAGVNPRHSILVLPFENVRQDPAVEWLRDGSVSMLALNLSQWNDLTVVDHERLHDLLARRELVPDAPVGLDMARRLARDAGVWTVVLGDYTRIGDSLQVVARVYDVASGTRLEVQRIEGAPGEDVRPLFDQLAARLLNVSGAPSGVSTGLAQVTTPSLAAYRSYLEGIEALGKWNLTTADRLFRRAVEIDTSFGLAHYKLSLTRGWVAGEHDSIGEEAIRRAARFSSRLSAHDRAMIEAYRLFLAGEHERSEQAYHALLASDSTDADAWYGLGDVTFHDPRQDQLAAHLTTSLRAFKRAIALDPNYYLAFEHLAQIYRWAALDEPFVALLPNDSLTLTAKGGPRAGLDSLTLATARRHARAEGVASARKWLTQQPDNVHAQNALIFALSASEQYDAALSEIGQLAARPGGSGRADLPFLQAQVQTAQGDVAEAVRTVERALDTVRAEDFDRERLPFSTIGEVMHGVNLLGWAGKLNLASRNLALASSLSALYMPDHLGSRRVGNRTLYHHLFQSHLATALGAPTRDLATAWNAIADSARKTPKDQREEVVTYGWAAALGLYLQNRGNPEPIDELQALGGGTTPPEINALRALDRRDTVRARELLLLPDSGRGPEYKGRPQWTGYRAMIAAHLWHDLGEDDRALRALDTFDPQHFSTMSMDVRWLLLGQARLLRGNIYERQGKRDQAREQYQLALTQWGGADELLEPLVTRLKSRLAGIGG